MTDFRQREVFVKKTASGTQKCSMMCVRVCVPTNKHGNIVLDQGLRKIFVLKREGIAEG